LVTFSSYSIRLLSQLFFSNIFLNLGQIWYITCKYNTIYDIPLVFLCVECEWENCWIKKYLEFTEWDFLVSFTCYSVVVFLCLNMIRLVVDIYLSFKNVQRENKTLMDQIEGKGSRRIWIKLLLVTSTHTTYVEVSVTL